MKKNMPDGMTESESQLSMGDLVIDKTNPEGLRLALELAKTYYYGESNRAAFLGINVNLGELWCFSYKWPSGKIPYAFDGYPESAKKYVQECMDEWEEGSDNSISFKETKSFNWWRNIWWNAGLLKVLKIRQKTHEGVSGLSTPGYCPRPFMDIDKKSLNIKSTLRHELGHVLGLQHEFDRYDRDDYIIIKDGMSWEDFSVGWFARLFINGLENYDYDSVMNYTSRYYKKNEDGSKGILIESPVIDYISQGDKNGIKYIYKKN